MNYLILIAGVVSALLAFFCLMFFIYFLIDPNSRDGGEETERRWIMAGATLGCLAFAYGTWRAYSSLSANDPQVLMDFYSWYSMGYISRFLLLLKRDALWPPHGKINWEEVCGTFFYALLGPGIMLHLIIVMLSEKD